MAQTYESRRLRLEREMDQRLTVEHRALARAVGALVQTAATARNEAGEAALPNTRAARLLLKELIWSRALKPFYIGAGDDPLRGPDPQSPYARLVVEGIRAAIRLQAERQSALVRARLGRHPQLLAFLTQNRARPVSEQRGIYDPYHLWVDPNGYRLSDRVWNASVDVRTRIDRLLDYEISRGTSAVRIANLLEDFLTPGASLIKTRTPYGREGAYAARRLARTEITAAAGRATINASAANPFVRGVRWVLSGAHAHEDECDQNAHGGPNGDGVYAPERVPKYPNHPHELCHLAPVADDDDEAIVDQLRREMVTQGPLAQALEGIFDPATLAGLIEDGSIHERVRQLVRAGGTPPPAVPTPPPLKPSPAPAVPAPPAKPYDLSYGAEVRRQIEQTQAPARAEIAQRDARHDELNATISRLVDEYVKRTEDSGLSPQQKEEMLAAQFATIRPLQEERSRNYDRLMELRLSFHTLVRPHLSAPAGTNARITTTLGSRFKGQKGLKALQKRIDDSLAFVNDITSDLKFDVYVDLDTSGRAYARRGEIAIGMKEEMRTIIHEIGHNIEYQRGASYRAKRLAFFKDRTAGDLTLRFKDEYPHLAYDDHEVFKRDRWFRDYVGKVYGNDSDTNSASELISMGIEQLSIDPQGLIERDPEFFDFLIGYLHGKL